MTKETNAKRDVAITIRMSPDEVEMLKAIAKAAGLSQSDIVRQYIRREHERLSRRQK